MSKMTKLESAELIVYQEGCCGGVHCGDCFANDGAWYEEFCILGYRHANLKQLSGAKKYIEEHGKVEPEPEPEPEPIEPTTPDFFNAYDSMTERSNMAGCRVENCAEDSKPLTADIVGDYNFMIDLRKRRAARVTG